MKIYNPQWIGDKVIGSNPPFYSKMDAESLSRQMFASCWNLGNDQDINLWDRFGNENVAIKTTVNRIKKGIPGYNTKYGISKITYVDYEDENIDFNLGINLDNSNCNLGIMLVLITRDFYIKILNFEMRMRLD